MQSVWKFGHFFWSHSIVEGRKQLCLCWLNKDWVTVSAKVDYATGLIFNHLSFHILASENRVEIEEMWAEDGKGSKESNKEKVND